MTGRRRSRDRPIWVIKLGGSLARSPLLRQWLDVLASGGGSLVLVPGGGPFADEVRAMQHLWRFGESSAHRMALMAMEQYGTMLAGLRPELRPAMDRTQIRETLGHGQVPVWMPTRMTLGRKEIAESWDVTADSLAAWLAKTLGADCMVLIKSAAVDPAWTLADLIQLGIVDTALPGFLADGRVECRCLEAGGHAAMADALATGTPPGTLIRAVLPIARASIAGNRRSANIRR